MNNCSASDYGIRQNGYKGLSKKKKNSRALSLRSTNLFLFLTWVFFCKGMFMKVYIYTVCITFVLKDCFRKRSAWNFERQACKPYLL